MQRTGSPQHQINYKLGSIYAVVTALLLSVQEPFSFLAAKRLNFAQFVFDPDRPVDIHSVFDCARKKPARLERAAPDYRQLR
jgi:hypothetical protein